MLYLFHRDEDGAVTVDWVVLTGAIVGLGLGVISASCATGRQNVGNMISKHLVEQTVTIVRPNERGEGRSLRNATIPANSRVSPSNSPEFAGDRAGQSRDGARIMTGRSGHPNAKGSDMRMIFGLVLILGIGLAGFAVYMARGYVSDYQAAAGRRARRGRARSCPPRRSMSLTRAIRYGERLTKEDVRAGRLARERHPRRHLRERRRDAVPRGETAAALGRCGRWKRTRR